MVVAAVDSAAVAGAAAVDEVEREKPVPIAGASAQTTEHCQAQARSLLTLMILFKDWRQLPPG